MYMQLINPIESDLAGNKLIIIPDEEIAYLPFDAFIKNQAAADQYGFEGLDFLIRTYSISYGYSSSLVFLKRDNEGSNEVYSFSPDYDNTAPDSDQKYIYLKGTREEIKSIYRYFKGMEFMGRQATESNFREALRHPAIFHLAMHSITDTLNSKYSFLAFDAQNDSLEDGKLYDYEISQSRIKSPMLVLSACNTGIGKLYQGEGVMSITRAFLLAGASSVVKTLWDVNDDAGAKIIAGFYKNLHAGQEKDEALRQAKLEFLKNSPPTYANPYYWAAYQVMGDKSPVKSGSIYYWIIGMVVILAAAAPGVLFYFRRRRILPD